MKKIIVLFFAAVTICCLTVRSQESLQGDTLLIKLEKARDLLMEGKKADLSEICLKIMQSHPDNKTLIFLVPLFAGNICKAAHKNEWIEKMKLKLTGLNGSGITFSLPGHHEFYQNLSLTNEMPLKNATVALKLDSIIYRKTINDQNELLTNAWKTEYYYNNESKYSEMGYREWDAANQHWKNYGNVSIDYYNTGKVSELISSNDIKKFKTAVYYNQDGLTDYANTFEFLNGNWLNTGSKQDFHYNENGQLIRIDWPSETSNKLYSAYQYNSSGKMESERIFISGYDNGEDFLFEHIIYSYNSSGQLTAKLDSFRTNGVDITEEFYVWKTEYECNEAGQVSTETFYTWNLTSNVWNPRTKSEYTYVDGNNTTAFYPKNAYEISYNPALSTGSVNNEITVISHYDLYGGQWILNGKDFFYFSGNISTELKEVREDLTVSVFPNPASGSISFSWYGDDESLFFQLSGITGHNVLEMTVYPGQPVSISNLERGIYLYRLYNDHGKTKAGRLVKQ